MSARDKVLIWSFEHDGWWRPNEVGYTKERWAAGIYLRDVAEKIVKGADEGNERIVELDDYTEYSSKPQTPDQKVEGLFIQLLQAIGYEGLKSPVVQAMIEICRERAEMVEAMRAAKTPAEAVALLEKWKTL